MDVTFTIPDDMGIREASRLITTALASVFSSEGSSTGVVSIGAPEDRRSISWVSIK